MSNKTLWPPFQSGVILLVLLVWAASATLIAIDGKKKGKTWAREALVLEFEDGFDRKVSIFAHTEDQYRLKREKAVKWMARILYTESPRASEQYFIAWTVRNRYEDHYQGATTYRGLALAPFEYSAFNDASKRKYYSSIGELYLPKSKTRWKQSLEIARYVISAPSFSRPIDKEALHFYAPVGMKGCTKVRQMSEYGCRPYWARGKSQEEIPIQVNRLRIFAGVS